jgi:hypothetical protein
MNCLIDTALLKVQGKFCPVCFALVGRRSTLRFTHQLRDFFLVFARHFLSHPAERRQHKIGQSLPLFSNESIRYLRRA